MASTLAFGTACRSRPQAPATCGDAIDVPSSASYPPPGTDEVMDTPGAHTERNGAELVNQATSSVFVVAPTLTADETHAGSDSWSGRPSLPAATTVATLTERRLSMIAL